MTVLHLPFHKTYKGTRKRFLHAFIQTSITKNAFYDNYVVSYMPFKKSDVFEMNIILKFHTDWKGHALKCRKAVVVLHKLSNKTS